MVMVIAMVIGMVMVAVINIFTIVIRLREQLETSQGEVERLEHQATDLATQVALVIMLETTKKVFCLADTSTQNIPKAQNIQGTAVPIFPIVFHLQVELASNARLQAESALLATRRELKELAVEHENLKDDFRALVR